MSAPTPEQLAAFRERVGANKPLPPHVHRRVAAIFEAPLPPLPAEVPTEQAS